METIDPKTVNPLPGILLVEITEVLGGMTKGGIFIPGTVMDHGRKDTAFGRVLKSGPPPKTTHTRYGHGYVTKSSDEPWPSPFVFEGDIVLFPRDVPKAFTFEDKRYALIKQEEVLLRHGADTSVRVIPWEETSNGWG